MYSIRALCAAAPCRLRVKQINWSHRSFMMLVKSQPNAVPLRAHQCRRMHEKNHPTDSMALLRWTRSVWSKLFGKYLLFTNTISCGVLMVVGDIMAQEYECRSGIRVQSDSHYDWERMHRMFWAGAVQGPMHHYVYKWMDLAMPQRTFRNIANKILIDQLVMSPVCIVLFFYTICLLERQSLEDTNKELFSKFSYIYMVDWLTWPAAQYVNFRYVDPKYRVGFVNVCTALYNVLISYIKHSFGLPLDGVVIESAVHTKQSEEGPGLKAEITAGPAKTSVA